jgi:molecular chaperone HscB
VPADNPFELFGLVPAFEIDERRLAETFRGLQRAVHPDRYARASDYERRLAVGQAAAVNDAYQVLRDPLRRARCLLSLRGVATREETNTVMDPAFLMEQMELRERLGEVQESADPSSTLEQVKNTLREHRAALLDELAAYFRAGTPEALTHAAERVRRLRFFDRLVEEVADLEEHFLDPLL